MIRFEDEGEKENLKKFWAHGLNVGPTRSMKKGKETVGVGLCHLAAVAILSSVPKEELWSPHTTFLLIFYYQTMIFYFPKSSIYI